MINKQTDWLSSNQPIGSNWMMFQIQKFEVLSSTHQPESVFFKQRWGAKTWSVCAVGKLVLMGGCTKTSVKFSRPPGFGGVDRPQQIEVVIVMDIC